jgi:hypothetical protein
MNPSAPRDPIVDLGVSYAMEGGISLSAAGVTSVRSIFDRFVRGLISYHDAAMLLSPVTGTTQALDRIDRILRTPATPLPPCQNPPSPQSKALSRTKSRPWSTYEDQRLFAAIHRLGVTDWHSIAGFVGNSRTKSQCYQRWSRGLDPHIDRAKWTPEQDAQLLMLTHVYSDKSWSKICSHFGNRCDLQCRSRYRQLRKDDRFAQMQKEAASAAVEFRKANGIPDKDDPQRAKAGKQALPSIYMLMAPPEHAGITKKTVAPFPFPPLPPPRPG